MSSKKTKGQKNRPSSDSKVRLQFGTLNEENRKIVAEVEFNHTIFRG